MREGTGPHPGFSKRFVSIAYIYILLTHTFLSRLLMCHMFIYHLYASKVTFLPHHCPYFGFLRPHNSLTVGEPFLLAARVNFVPGNVKYALLLHPASCFFRLFVACCLFLGQVKGNLALQFLLLERFLHLAVEGLHHQLPHGGVGMKSTISSRHSGSLKSWQQVLGPEQQSCCCCLRCCSPAFSVQH